MSIKKFVIIALVIVALAGGAFYLLKIRGARLGGQTAEEKAKAEELNRREEAAVQWEVNKKTLLVTDKDLDGLTDAEEAKFGTDANNPDTDNDGLLDKVEIETYKTDPKNPDTDGDGKKDGYEVRRGLNPLKNK